METEEKKYARDFAESRKESKIVADWYEDGIRIVIMSLHSHFTAYVGMPLDHPISGKDYDDLPVSAHGGLTFSSAGSDKYLPVGYYWYGWDYTHAGDYHYPGKEMLEKYPELYGNTDNEHDWTLEEVKSDIWSAVYDFKKLVKLAESIAKK